jgi:hypothetical protein
MSERLDDGFSTTIAFADAAGIKLYEKTLTPPGVAGGGSNDVTTMRNTAWRTMSPKKLKTLTEASFTAAYDPAVYDTIVAQINNNQLITVTFPDDSTLAFWGWLDEFTPNEHVEGEQPTAEVTILPSNHDDSLVEVAPVMTPSV